MKNKFLLILFFVAVTLCMRQKDRVPGPPGMKDTAVFSGYLDTFHNDRKLHYVFVQAEQKPEQASLVIWLNGGPGCSSLIGFMQQIGPFIVGSTYNDGEILTKNPFRWNKAANVLFIESPGIVGFSTDTNYQVTYSDRQTADDSFAAIKDFVWNVAQQFKSRQLFISGQSYAGKYIPDLAVRIIDHNREQNVSYINLKGILIGNGIMNHADNSLTKSKIQFMIDHDFISDRLLSVYKNACQIDFFSPRCEYFKYEFHILKSNLNGYNVYEVCYDSDYSVQDIRTEQFLDKVQKKLKQIQNNKQYGLNTDKQFKSYAQLKQIQKCYGDAGMITYLNMYKATYNIAVNKTWEACSDIKYDVTVQASMPEYEQIFLNKGIKVWLFSGDWDDVVPYPDTVHNLKLLKRKKVGSMQPWFVGQTHAGFYQIYDSNNNDHLNLITIKGSGHYVPFFKPAAAYQMLYNFIKNRPINTPV